MHQQRRLQGRTTSIAMIMMHPFVIMVLLGQCDIAIAAAAATTASAASKSTTTGWWSSTSMPRHQRVKATAAAAVYQRSSQKQKKQQQQPLDNATSSSSSSSSPSSTRIPSLTNWSDRREHTKRDGSVRRVAVFFPKQSALEFLDPPKPISSATAAASTTKSRHKFRILSLNRPSAKSATSATATTTTTAVPTEPEIATRVGALTKHFETVLCPVSSSHASATVDSPIRSNTKGTMSTSTLTSTTVDTSTKRIDMAQLLTACRAFEIAMVQVGQKLSAKDLRNNIDKAVAYYDTAPDTVRRDMRTLLEHEKATNIHDYSGQHARGTLHLLKDPSCAMGLLWIRRSLQFQYTLFEALLHASPSPALDNDHTIATAASATTKSETDVASRAAVHAYEQTLQPYHGFALRKLYQVAVQTATPSRHEWMARLGGFSIEKEKSNSGNSGSGSNTNTNVYFGVREQQATQRDLQRLLDIWKPLIEYWVELYAELDLEDLRRV